MYSGIVFFVKDACDMNLASIIASEALKFSSLVYRITPLLQLSSFILGLLGISFFSYPILHHWQSLSFSFCLFRCVLFSSLEELADLILSRVTSQL